MTPDEVGAPTLALSVAEAAHEVRISERQLRTYLARNEGPSVCRLGRRVVVRREALDEWLRDHEVAADTPAPAPVTRAPATRETPSTSLTGGRRGRVAAR